MTPPDRLEPGECLPDTGDSVCPPGYAVDPPASGTSPSRPLCPPSTSLPPPPSGKLRLQRRSRHQPLGTALAIKPARTPSQGIQRRLARILSPLPILPSLPSHWTKFSPFRPPLRVSLPPWSRHSGPSRSRTSLRQSRLSLSVRHSSSNQELSLSFSPECGGAQLRLPRQRPHRLRRDPRRELLLLLPPTRSTSLRHVLYRASVAPILWCPRAPRCSGFHICPIGHDVSLHHPIPAGLPPPALLHPEKLKRANQLLSARSTSGPSSSSLGGPRPLGVPPYSAPPDSSLGAQLRNRPRIASSRGDLATVNRRALHARSAFVASVLPDAAIARILDGRVRDSSSQILPSSRREMARTSIAHCGGADGSSLFAKLGTLARLADFAAFPPNHGADGPVDVFAHTLAPLLPRFLPSDRGLPRLRRIGRALCTQCARRPQVCCKPQLD